MVSEGLQDQVVRYVSGEMPEAERDSFEVLLAWREDLQRAVDDAAQVVALAAFGGTGPTPSAGLRARLLDSLPRRANPSCAESLVVTDAAGRVEWVNDAFVAMCGHSLAELQGRKPGEVLQGPATDRAAVERIRGALRAGRSCRETLVNYHKDGTTYRADVRISPILNDDGQPLYFVARERKVEAPASLVN